MNSLSESEPSSCTRRRILGWGGFGIMGALAGYLGLRTNTPSKATANRANSAGPTNATQTVPGEAPAAIGGSRRDDFLPHLHSQFRLHSHDIGESVCELVEIGPPQRLVAKTGEFTSFSMLFAAPAGFAADSVIYQVSHPALGEMEMFLSPVGHSKERVTLEAVFSERV